MLDDRDPVLMIRLVVHCPKPVPMLAALQYAEDKVIAKVK